jgi:tRNA-dihydrouridine synthase B
MIDLPRGALLYAPMEGITDSLYRQTVVETCPGWDVLACDFLRVPSAGRYPVKHLRAHMGAKFLEDAYWAPRTMYQILAAEKSFTEEIARQLQDLAIPWVDLNLGCPSNTVCKSGGGSFLLKDITLMSRIVGDVRRHFKGRFTCKVRVGWGNGDALPDIIRALNDQGVEMITVHGRTREQMYKEPANWNWITQAVKVSKVPVVGNGDVWCAEDARRMLDETGCHAVMVARGALKTPWLPLHYKEGLPDTPESRREMIRLFISNYSNKLLENGVNENGLCRQLKSVTRYLFEGLPESQTLRRKVLLSQTSASILEELI